MLFTETQLSTNPLGILDQAVYLTNEEASIVPSMISVIENSRLQAIQIPFAGIKSLVENNGVGFIDAIASICEADKLNPNSIVITIDEADVIKSPEILEENVPFIVAPISENDSVYQFCEALCNEFIETGDESLFDTLCEGRVMANLKWLGRGIAQTYRDKKEDSWLAHPMRKIRERREDHAYNTRYKFNTLNTHDTEEKSKLRHAALAVSPHKILGKAIDKIDSFQHKPRNVIARKIASLRKIYTKFLKRSQEYIDDNRASMFRKACFYITKAIDKLLGWLQDKANNVQYRLDSRK